MKDHYRTLGVESDAEPAEIRRAYLRLARVHHPDQHVGGPPADKERHERLMREVNEAWEILGDRALRADYDRARLRPRRGSAGPARSSGGPEVPEGKGWTPRADDTGWQQDFAAWRDEDARLADDPPGRGAGPIMVLPTGLVLAAAISSFLGVVLEARPLLAFAFGAFFVAVMLFVILPFRELGRSRSSDRTGGTR